MILTATPLRVSLFGGGSDYPEWFLAHGGAVLGMAINKYVYVGIKDMPPGQKGADGQPLKFRIQYSHVDDCQDAEQIQHPAVRAAIKYFGLQDRPLEFHIFGDLPGRSGLGGSSAFTVGLLHAIRRFLEPQRDFDPLELAQEAIPFEQFVIRETVGYQDQIFAAAGGIRFVEFNQQGNTAVHTLSISPERLAELEQSLILVYTGTMRDAHVMASRYVAKIPTNETLLKKTVRQAHYARSWMENSKYVPINMFGWTLHQAWEWKRSICPDTTTPEIDALYSHGLDWGATGGKLLGAGGGGFILFFVPPERRTTFETRIQAPCVSFRVSPAGSSVVINNL
mgnify:CR=1 FL=1